MPRGYFERRPKEDPRYLYGRDAEVAALLEAVERKEPLILVLGLRRLGKTSLIRCSCSRLPESTGVVDLDLRSLAERVRVRRGEFLSMVTKAASSLTGRGFHLERHATLADFLTDLNRQAERLQMHVVIVLDEAQEIRRVVGLRADAALAYAYDNLRSLSFVVSGSKFGLKRALGFEESASPLYARTFMEIGLSPFSREQAAEFLRVGFQQNGVQLEEQGYDAVVNSLDGIPGWLVEFGAGAVEKAKAGMVSGGLARRLLGEVVRKGGKIIEGELRSFLALRDRPTADRYMALLQTVASLGQASWSAVKAGFEMRMRLTIQPKRFTELLNRLVEESYVEKADGRYSVSDWVLREYLLSGQRVRFP